MRLILPLLVALAGAACVRTTPPPSARDTPGAERADVVAAFVALLERERGDRGCTAPLEWNARVADVAQGHTRDMARRGYLDHVDPDGLDPFDRLRAAGVAYRAAAENIAHGPTTGEQVLELWLHSAGHRRNMLKCEFTQHGVGFERGYWTHVLITPR